MKGHRACCCEKNESKNNINGRIYIKLSNLSNMPPWPGRIFPESFTPKVLLMDDSTKSPSVPTTHAAAAINIQNMPAFPATAGEIPYISDDVLKYVFPIHHAIGKEMKPAPKNPSQLFFGEIFSKSLCFPIRDPMR